jgi:hypothetical protein
MPDSHWSLLPWYTRFKAIEDTFAIIFQRKLVVEETKHWNVDRKCFKVRYWSIDKAKCSCAHMAASSKPSHFSVWLQARLRQGAALAIEQERPETDRGNHKASRGIHEEASRRVYETRNHKKSVQSSIVKQLTIRYVAKLGNKDGDLITDMRMSGFYQCDEDVRKASVFPGGWRFETSQNGEETYREIDRLSKRLQDGGTSSDVVNTGYDNILSRTMW